MSEARECAGCGGGGDDCAVMRSHHEDRPCRFCKGTGKVWPSVEGEIVSECELGGYCDIPADGRLFVRVPWGAGTVVRVIVQPLPSPDGRGVKEEA